MHACSLVEIIRMSSGGSAFTSAMSLAAATTTAGSERLLRLAPLTASASFASPRSKPMDACPLVMLQPTSSAPMAIADVVEAVAGFRHAVADAGSQHDAHAGPDGCQQQQDAAAEAAHVRLSQDASISRQGTEPEPSASKPVASHPIAAELWLLGSGTDPWVIDPAGAEGVSAVEAFNAATGAAAPTARPASPRMAAEYITTPTSTTAARGGMPPASAITEAASPGSAALPAPAAAEASGLGGQSMRPLFIPVVLAVPFEVSMPCPVHCIAPGAIQN